METFWMALLLVQVTQTVPPVWISLSEQVQVICESSSRVAGYRLGRLRHCPVDQRVLSTSHDVQATHLVFYALQAILHAVSCEHLVKCRAFYHEHQANCRVVFGEVQANLVVVFYG